MFLLLLSQGFGSHVQFAVVGGLVHLSHSFEVLASLVVDLAVFCPFGQPTCDRSIGLFLPICSCGVGLHPLHTGFMAIALPFRFEEGMFECLGSC